MYKYFFLSVLLFAFVFPVKSQEDKKYIRKGNELYNRGKYKDAEKLYRESQQKNNASQEAAFNIADALYKQKKFDESANQFKQITQQTKDKKKLADAYHNLGNSLLQSKKYEESVQAYCNALKNSPKDAATKYNLAYAQKKLQQQQQQQNKDKDKKDKKDDKEKDQKDKDEKDNKDKKKDKEDDKNKDGEDKKEEQKKDSQAKNKMTKEEAMRLLEALNNQEKNVQEKLKKMAGKEENINIEKDW